MTIAAYEVEYKVLDKTYSVVLTTAKATRKCIDVIADRGRSHITRHVVLSEETGKIVSRGAVINQDDARWLGLAGRPRFFGA